MYNTSNTAHLMELMQQAVVVVDIQSNEIAASNSMAAALFSGKEQATKLQLQQLKIHVASADAVRQMVRKELQTTGKSILHHIGVKTAATNLESLEYYDIHIAYVDEACQSVYLIFAESAYNRQKKAQQKAYYSALCEASYAYPFCLDVQKKRMEFFNPIGDIHYHIPIIMENFPEPLFAYQYIFEDDMDAYVAAVERMYKGESPEGSFRFYDVNGNVLRYSLNYVVTRDAQGQPIQVTGDFIMQSTVQKTLEYTQKLQHTIHQCVDLMFAVSASNQNQNVAYTAIVNHLKEYYQAQGAYFYQFVAETHTIEHVHVSLDEHLSALEQTFPAIMKDEQLKVMEFLSNINGSDMQNGLDALGDDCKSMLLQQQKLYQIRNFSSVAITNMEGDTIGFMGIINAKLHKSQKELMERLSRPICMFVEFQKEQAMQQELLKLEASSKADVVKECVDNFREFTHCKEHISSVLYALCHHYDADVAVTLTRDATHDGEYSISYLGGPAIPNFDGLQRQPAHAMQKWAAIFEQHKHFVTDADLDNPQAKRLLKEKFGIYNFIAAPIKDEHGVLAGLLYVMNFKALHRSNLLTHIVANNISTYLDKVHMYEEKHLEPMTKLTDKVATQNQIAEHLEDGSKGALFVIDIDHFKQLNDTLGHQMGDCAIIALAKILRKAFRSTDVIGRIGGDEFMAFCPALTDVECIHAKAQHLLKKCNLHYEKDGVTVSVTASIGVCRVSEQCNTFQSLYEKADEVLYVSKNNGKNQYRIYTSPEQDG